MKRILVTGSSGFIGSAFIYSALGQFEIIGLDLVPSGFKQIVEYIGSVEDSRLITEIFETHQIDIVVHLAALKNASASLDNTDAFMKINYESTINLITAAERFQIERFIFASSAAIYGESLTTNGLIYETTPPAPLNPYGNSKLQAEMAIAQFSSQTGVPSVILRFFNVCGRSQGKLFNENLSDFVSLAARKAHQKENILIFGKSFKTKDGSAVRDYVNIKDVVESIKLSCLQEILGSHSEIFNICTGKGTSVVEVVEILEALHKSKIVCIASEERPGELGQSIGSYGKILDRWSWAPKFSIRESIREVYLSETRT